MRDYISGLENALDQGREEGIEQKTREAAFNMKADGLPNSIIAKYLGISEAKVKELIS